MLLVATGILTYRLDLEMHANRQIRVDVAEIQDIQYGLLNANTWAERIEPIFSNKIAAFDLTASNKDALRPVLQKMVDSMILQAGGIVRVQIANNKTLSIFGPQMGQFLGSLFDVDSLRAHAPEFTETILSELGKPEAKKAIQESLKKALFHGSPPASAPVDMTQYSGLLQKYGCSSGTECRALLSKQIDDADSRIGRYTVSILAIVGLAFAVMLIRRSPLSMHEIVVLGIFCAILLWAGLRNPMIDIDARISRLSFELAGEPVEFTDQVLFYQSKSIIDVVRLLLETGKAGMVIVGLMVLAFSVVFPIAKLAASAIYCYRVRGLEKNSIVQFFALKSGKWSMADVLVVALFMAYIGFDGVISTQLSHLREAAAGIDVLTTNHTTLRAGFYLFLSFCFAGLLLSMAMERAGRRRTTRQAMGVQTDTV
jgi:hypothetical protein